MDGITRPDEGHRLDLLGRGGDGETLGITFQISVHPGEGVARFLAVVLDRGHRPVALLDEQVPLPARGWEIRTSGLWADLNCETPGEHWSYGLEAFALALDSPEQLVEGDVGDRVPLGWELDFQSEEVIESAAAPEAVADTAAPGVTRQPGQAHGLLLGPHPTIELAGPAVRHHWRGVSRPWTVEVGNPGSDVAPDRVVVPFDGCRWDCALWPEGLRCVLDRLGPPQRG